MSDRNTRNQSSQRSGKERNKQKKVHKYRKILRFIELVMSCICLIANIVFLNTNFLFDTTTLICVHAVSGAAIVICAIDLISMSMKHPIFNRSWILISMSCALAYFFCCGLLIVAVKNFVILFSVVHGITGAIFLLDCLYFNKLANVHECESILSGEAGGKGEGRKDERGKGEGGKGEGGKGEGGKGDGREQGGSGGGGAFVGGGGGAGGGGGGTVRPVSSCDETTCGDTTNESGGQTEFSESEGDGDQICRPCGRWKRKTKEISESEGEGDQICKPCGRWKRKTQIEPQPQPQPKPQPDQGCNPKCPYRQHSSSQSSPRPSNKYCHDKCEGLRSVSTTESKPGRKYCHEKCPGLKSSSRPTKHEKEKKYCHSQCKGLTSAKRECDPKCTAVQTGTTGTTGTDPPNQGIGGVREHDLISTGTIQTGSSSAQCDPECKWVQTQEPPKTDSGRGRECDPKCTWMTQTGTSLSQCDPDCKGIQTQEPDGDDVNQSPKRVCNKTCRAKCKPQPHTCPAFQGRSSGSGRSVENVGRPRRQVSIGDDMRYSSRGKTCTTPGRCGTPPSRAGSEEMLPVPSTSRELQLYRPETNIPGSTGEVQVYSMVNTQESASPTGGKSSGTKPKEKRRVETLVISVKMP